MPLPTCADRGFASGHLAGGRGWGLDAASLGQQPPLDEVHEQVYLTNTNPWLPEGEPILGLLEVSDSDHQGSKPPSQLKNPLSPERRGEENVWCCVFWCCVC